MGIMTWIYTDYPPPKPPPPPTTPFGRLQTPKPRTPLGRSGYFIPLAGRLQYQGGYLEYGKANSFYARIPN